MAFVPEPVRTPAEIKDIEIVMTSIRQDDGSFVDEVKFTLQIEFDDGSIKVVSGDLQSELTGGQLPQLRGIMTSVRARARSAILPPRGQVRNA